MTAISIAMATYNGARYLPQQLASLAGQSVLPAELVVTDDGSTDSTLDILASFAAEAPFPVRIERNARRMGYRANFIKTAGMCRSEFIAFCDQDDVWMPEKLETCLRAFTREDVLLAYHEALVTDENLEFPRLLNRAPAKTFNRALSMSPACYGYGFTLVFRRLLLSFDDYWHASYDYQSTDEKEAHDQWFCFLASSLGTVVYIGQPLAFYRRHCTATTGSPQNSASRTKIGRLFTPNLAALKSCALSATGRAFALNNIQEDVDGVYHTRAIAARERYRKLETYYRLRLNLYNEEGFSERSAQILQLLAEGKYLSRHQFGSGYAALLRDALSSLPLLQKQRTPMFATS